jgi:hypothetical protein
MQGVRLSGEKARVSDPLADILTPERFDIVLGACPFCGQAIDADSRTTRVRHGEPHCARFDSAIHMTEFLNAVREARANDARWEPITMSLQSSGPMAPGAVVRVACRPVKSRVIIRRVFVSQMPSTSRFTITALFRDGVEMWRGECDPRNGPDDLRSTLAKHRLEVAAAGTLDIEVRNDGPRAQFFGAIIGVAEPASAREIQ